jgi:hypothetical protein
MQGRVASYCRVFVRSLHITGGTLDWLTFISKIIEACGWPLAVVIVVLLLRRQVQELIPALKRLKAGPLEAEFEKRVAEFAAEAQLPSSSNNVELPAASDPARSANDEKVLLYAKHMLYASFTNLLMQNLCMNRADEDIGSLKSYMDRAYNDYFDMKEKLDRIMPPDHPLREHYSIIVNNGSRMLKRSTDL